MTSQLMCHLFSINLPFRRPLRVTRALPLPLSWHVLHAHVLLSWVPSEYYRFGLRLSQFSAMVLADAGLRHEGQLEESHSSSLMSHLRLVSALKWFV